MASREGLHCPAEDAQGETGFLETLHSPQARRLPCGKFETDGEKPADASQTADFCIFCCLQFDDGEEEELETEGSIDQEMGSSFGSPLDADVTEADLEDDTSTQNPAPLPSPNPHPQVTDVMSLNCPHLHKDEGPANQPDHTANTSQTNILTQFAEVMLADMRHIRDPLVLMKLRRDITDLVFKAVEEDERRRCFQVPSVHRMGESKQVQGFSRPQRVCPQGKYSWRQMIQNRKSKGCESGRRMQKWEEMRHLRRMSRTQVLEPAQQGQATEGTSEHSSQVIIQTSEIKKEMEPHVVKMEQETHLEA